MPDSENPRPRVLVSHPTGNTFSRALVEGLHEAALLERFVTCLGVGSDASGILAKVLAQRACPIPKGRLQTHPVREAFRLISQKSGLFAGLRRHETGPLSVDRVYHSLDHFCARTLREAVAPPSAVYAYEDGAKASFEAARELQIPCLYDLPIGYWRTARSIQGEEAERLPEWKATMPALRDSESKLARKDAELRLADEIIVASRFTAKTLEDAPFSLPDPFIVPYGCPPVAEGITEAKAPNEGPLRVLYVGGLTQRKGISYLIEAVDRLKGLATLTLVGRRVADCKPLDEALQRHEWIESLPHEEVLATMRRHDVLVFPSLFEGFGLVLTEALSQGLPVIATPNTCAPDLIEDGREGYVVPIRDSDVIATRLESLAKDREQLGGMRLAALETARKCSWANYRAGMVDVVTKILEARKGSPL